MGRFEDALKKAAKERRKVISNQSETSLLSEFEVSRIETDPYLFYTKQKSFYTDQYQTLRLNIERKLKHKKNASVLITSSSRGEGKTTTVLNLAFTLISDIDTKKILIIDGDLRKPAIASSLKIDYETGLSDILTGKISWEEPIIKEVIPKMDILPAGNIPDNPVDLLHSKKLNPLFESLKKIYDWLLVDSSPVLLFSDPLSFVEVIDGLVFVIKTGKTSKPVIQRATDIFPKDKILGYVMNQIEYPIPNFIYRLLFGKTHSYDYYYS